MKTKLSEKVAEYKSLNIPMEEKFEKRTKCEDQIRKIDAKINMIICEPEHIVPFLVPGRFLKIKSENINWGWGILVSWTKQRINPKKFLMASGSNKKGQGIDVLTQTENHYILDILLYVKNKLTNENLL